MDKFEASRLAAPMWIAKLKNAPILTELDAETLARLLTDLTDTKLHDEQVVRVHAETVMGTLRKAMVEAIAEAEVRGYKKQIDERLAAALVQASYKPVVPGLMGDVM